VSLLMDYTDEGRTRIDEIWSDDLVFDITHVAYGSSGFNAGSPESPLALNPAATALLAEVFRKEVTAVSVDEMSIPRGKETVYTTVSGDEFTSITGEAGLIATVTDAGTTGLAVGYEFLIAHCHFGRIVFDLFSRMPIAWPLDLQGNILSYFSGAKVVIGNTLSMTPETGNGSYGAYALFSGTLPSGASLNAGTGEIIVTPDAAALLGGSPAGVYSGIIIQADGTVVSKPITFTILGVALPAPIFYSTMEIDALSGFVLDGTGELPATMHGPPTAVAGTVGNGLNFVAAGGGNGDYLEVPDNADLSIGVGDYTIVGAVKVTGGGSTDIELLNKMDLLANPGWRVLVEPTLTTLSHGDSIGSYANLTFPHASLDDGSFHTVVVSVDRDVGAEAFIDGISIGTSVLGITLNAGSIDNAEPMYIGANEVGGINTVTTAEIDEVGLFSAALDGDQAATVAWLNVRGMSLASWIRKAPPSTPTYTDQLLSDGVFVSFLPTVPALDDQGIVSYVAIDALPSGLSIDDITGEVSGVPSLSVGSGVAASLGASPVATGTLTTDNGVNIVDGESFTLDDGVNAAVTFEFDNNSSVVESATLRQVPFTVFDIQSQVRDAIITAVTNAPLLLITATNGGVSQVDLTHDRSGTAGNVAITQSGTPLLGITGMSGGGDMVVTGLSGMTPGSVGHRLIITGVSDPFNGGTFEITAYNSATSVDVSIPSLGGSYATGSDANNTAIVWEERDYPTRQVRFASSDGLNLSILPAVSITIV